MASQNELLIADLADAYRQHHCQSNQQWSHIIFNRIRSLQAEVKRQEWVIKLWRDVVQEDRCISATKQRLDDIDPDWREHFDRIYKAAEHYAQEIVEAALGKEIDHD